MTKNTKPKILVVDDNEAKLYSLSRNLIAEGFDIITALTGAEVFKQLEQKPDLILLDVNLPDISGYEVCQKIKSDTSLGFIPIIHVSATFTDSQHQVYGMDKGADGYLTEPLDRHVLGATIRVFLRLKNAEREIKRLADEFKALADNLPDMVCRIDLQPAPHYSYVNSVSTQILGYTPDEHYADPELRLKIVHPDDKNFLEQAMKNSFTDIQTFTARYYHKNGALVYLETHIRPLFNEQNELTALLSISRDITARKQRELEIERLIDEQEVKKGTTDENLIPICGGCKRIRNEFNEWEQIESYFQNSMNIKFTHGICPDCVALYYPDYRRKGEQNAK